MVVPEITPTPQPVTEPWLIQIEWPPYMVYGDSDVLRFTLTPTENGILAKTEFPDHETIEQELEIVRPGDARIDAIARLDATGFEISPASEQARTLAPGEPVTWRWSVTPRQAGRQRLAISLVLKQYPQASAPAGPGTERILAAYSISQEVSVYSFFGMSRATASMVGFLGRDQMDSRTGHTAAQHAAGQGCRANCGRACAIAAII
jgi:hypothetical protein